MNEFKPQKFCLFLQEWRFGRSRPSEVIDFGANRKCVCDFLLVRNSNLGPILHHFGDMTAFICCWPHPIIAASHSDVSLTSGRDKVKVMTSSPGHWSHTVQCPVSTVHQCPVSSGALWQADRLLTRRQAGFPSFHRWCRCCDVIIALSLCH